MICHLKFMLVLRYSAKLVKPIFGVEYSIDFFKQKTASISFIKKYPFVMQKRVLYEFFNCAWHKYMFVKMGRCWNWYITTHKSDMWMSEYK